MKKNYPSIIVFVLAIIFVFQSCQKNKNEEKLKKFEIKKKTQEEKRLYSIERELYEFNMQKNPVTGTVSKDEKQIEYENSLSIKQQTNYQRSTSNIYTSRGPSNLGGRTRAFAVDISDTSSSTMISGGVSSGLFRTTDGGASWIKVSSNDEIHNVTAVAQDPRAGFENNWYYATGEWSGNSASLGSAYRGQGVWKSTDRGLTWAQIPETNSVFESFDSNFDYINALEVNPISGDLLIAATGKIFRYDGTNLIIELELSSNATGWTDVIVTSNGRAYASLQDDGVWTSSTGNGSWTRIAENDTPTDWASTGRIVLAEAPSNNNIMYALYVNGQTGIEADLWQYNLGTASWTNYSSKLPDEPDGDSSGNDPFAVQGGYDLVLSVKPDNENFVVIGGTNIYKIQDIVNDATFLRIGGYANNRGYSLYGGIGDTHHPDIHSLEFDPNTTTTFYSGTDGGVHKTTDIESVNVTWNNLNNNYVTYQYHHVALDPKTGSNMVLGGAQDNGTTVGGTDAPGWGLTDNTSMTSIAGGDGVAVEIARRNDDADYQFYLGTQQGNMYRFSPETGYAVIKPEGSPSGNTAQFVTYFYLDPDNNDHLYYAGNSTLYRTDSSEVVTSLNWSDLGSLPLGITTEKIRTLATTRGTYDPLTSSLLIGGDDGSIYRLKDPKNVTSLSTSVERITPSGASAGTIVSGLAIHPTNPDIVLAVYANYGVENIFLTTNATTDNPTWTMVERNLSAHSVRSAAITVVGSEITYFVGTARGLYSSTDPTNNDWEIEGANTIGLALVSRLVYRPSDNKLLIGTHGNGMFETTVEGTLSTTNVSKEEPEISFYPNPTQKELNLQSNTLDLSKSVVYSIFDVTGKFVRKGTVKNRKIDVETLNSGVYFVNLITDGKKQDFKFIKN